MRWALLAGSAVTLAGCGLPMAVLGDADRPTPEPEVTRTRATARPTPTGTAAAYPGVSGAALDAKLRAALGRARSVHVEGTLIEDGGLTKLVADHSSGRRSRVSIRLGSSQMAIIRDGSTYYVRGNEAFWVRSLGKREGRETAAEVGDRWLRVSGNVPLEFARLAGPDAVEQFVPATKGKVTRVHGIAWKGVHNTGLRRTQNGAVVTVYLPATGTPYPLYLQSADDVSSLRFERWDEPVTIAVPAGDQVVR